MLKTTKTEWRPIIHRFWNSSVYLIDYTNVTLNNQIICLLLISKNRLLSNSIIVENIFVKGIVMKIIKNLCELRQEINM